MDTVTTTLEALEPSMDQSSPDVGPGESATIDVVWADPIQCFALFVDDEFVYMSNVAESDTFGSASIDLTWNEWVDYIEDATGETLDLSVENTISMRIYDDYQANPDNCLSGATPTVGLLSVDGIDLALLPLDPELLASKDAVGPTEDSDLSVDRETYGNLVAAQFIDNTFVGCMLVSDIPDTVNWDSLDDSYSRDTEHAVTYAIYPIFGDNGFDLGDLCGIGLASSGLDPLTMATVILTTADLASTGTELGALGWFGALAMALGVRMVIRRRKVTA